MGASESMYVDGDIPRKTYDILAGPGWAYYRVGGTTPGSRDIGGRCCGCDVNTNWWMVSDKMSGRWVCQGCKATGAYPIYPLKD